MNSVTRIRERYAVGASIAVAFACLCASPAGATTIAVDTTADAIAADGHCSLREAISSANADIAPFAGPGECAAGQGADSVALGAGTFTLSITGLPEDSNASGDLD